MTTWYLTDFQATGGGETNSGGCQRLLLRLPVLRLEAGSLASPTWQPLTLFVMRLNDRAGEMRYIDPVTEQER